MSIEPGTVDMGSMSALREAFRSAPEPALEDLVGTHEGEFIGPGWLRATGDGVLLGMTFGIPASPASGAPFLLRRTG